MGYTIQFEAEDFNADGDAIQREAEVTYTVTAYYPASYGQPEEMPEAIIADVVMTDGGPVPDTFEAWLTGDSAQERLIAAAGETEIAAIEDAADARREERMMG